MIYTIFIDGVEHRLIVVSQRNYCSIDWLIGLLFDLQLFLHSFQFDSIRQFPSHTLNAYHFSNRSLSFPNEHLFRLFFALLQIYDPELRFTASTFYRDCLIQ